MIFFILHQSIHNLLPFNYSNQTKNLITLLIGIFLYTIIWTYVKDPKRADSHNLLLNSLKMGFTYIFMTDCLAMGIIYKNYYNKSIVKEAVDVWNVGDAKIPYDNIEDQTTNYSTQSAPVFNEIIKNKPKVIKKVRIAKKETIIPAKTDTQENIDELSEETQSNSDNDSIECSDGICQLKRK